MVRICLYVCVCVALPMVVDAWSMYGSFMSTIIITVAGYYPLPCSENVFTLV